jgi:proline iminopeptidase
MRRFLVLAALLALAGWTLFGARGSSLAQERPGLQHPPGEQVTINGAKLWVESEGKGPPVILVAGGPGLSHDYFHPYFSGLASRCRLIYYDPYGRGKSARAASPSQYTFDRDVEDLDGVRKALGLAKVSLCGHSYGGLVALAYAFRHPEAVARVALVNGVFSARSWQAANDDVNRQIRDQMPDVWAAVQRLRARGLKSSSEAHQQAYRLPPGFYWHRRPARLPNLMVSGDVYYAIAGDDADFVLGGELGGLDFEPRLKELQGRLLVLAGRYDNITPVRFVLPLEEEAPQATIVVLEESGHFAFVEETDRTLKVLGDFFTRK